jgi:hypothetical protein
MLILDKFLDDHWLDKSVYEINLSKNYELDAI